MFLDNTMIIGDRMKKIVFLVISVIIGILVYRKNDEIIIPTDAIRVRIIANSNNIKDLYEKKKIKENIKNDLYKLVDKVNSSKEADTIISNNLEYVNELVSKNTNDYKISYGLNYFPKKLYKGVVYPEGKYKSLVITLGSGLGDNWWCVLYPPLCLIDDDNSESVEYRLFVEEMLND